MVANECNAIPEYLPSRWNVERFGDCACKADSLIFFNRKLAGDNQQISFWSILLAVQIESFLWGLGTALGELPPYFVARAG